jgi:2-oxopent-4-enoate/cis-2-oxohex-4-enoate hydratase
MTIDANRLDQLASTLWEARTTRKACKPPGELAPGLTLKDAYAVSRRIFERKLSQGSRSIGRKIGLTSLAVQTQLGVKEPDFGYLTSEMRLENKGTLPAGSLLQGKAEGEVAFVLGKSLKGPGITPADVMAATDHVIACIEIIDSRVENWKIKIEDTVSDNASSAFFVLGSEKKKLSEIDLRLAGMKLTRNGQIESTGVGAACLDHPMNAVAWLANTLGSLGDTLSAGDIVLSGAYGPVVPFQEGDSVTVAISGLGEVSCTYAGGSK